MEIGIHSIPNSAADAVSNFVYEYICDKYLVNILMYFLLEKKNILLLVLYIDFRLKILSRCSTNLLSKYLKLYFLVQYSILV